jgi:hypothetical protein
MKAMNSILTASVLAALSVGAANASTVATYNVSGTTTITGQTTGSGTNIGTAILDDSGVLTVNYSANHITTAASGGFTSTSKSIFTGSYSGGVLTVTGATVQNLTCVPDSAANPAACSANLLLGTVQTQSNYVAGTDSGGIPMNITSAGITYDNLFDSNLASDAFFIRSAAVSGAAITTVRATFTKVNAVPVPAAAWLFGSGLLGLAGTARRRRAAATVA